MMRTAPQTPDTVETASNATVDDEGMRVGPSSPRARAALPLTPPPAAQQRDPKLARRRHHQAHSATTAIPAPGIGSVIMAENHPTTPRTPRTPRTPNAAAAGAGGPSASLLPNHVSPSPSPPTGASQSPPSAKQSKQSKQSKLLVGRLVRRSHHASSRQPPVSPLSIADTLKSNRSGGLASPRSHYTTDYSTNGARSSTGTPGGRSRRSGGGAASSTDSAIDYLLSTSGDRGHGHGASGYGRGTSSAPPPLQPELQLSSASASTPPDIDDNDDKKKKKEEKKKGKSMGIRRGRKKSSKASAPPQELYATDSVAAVAEEAAAVEGRTRESFKGTASPKSSSGSRTNNIHRRADDNNNVSIRTSYRGSTVSQQGQQLRTVDFAAPTTPTPTEINGHENQQPSKLRIRVKMDYDKISGSSSFQSSNDGDPGSQLGFLYTYGLETVSCPNLLATNVPRRHADAVKSIMKSLALGMASGANAPVVSGARIQADGMYLITVEIADAAERDRIFAKLMRRCQAAVGPDGLGLQSRIIFLTPRCEFAHNYGSLPAPEGKEGLRDAIREKLCAKSFTRYVDGNVFNTSSPGNVVRVTHYEAFTNPFWTVDWERYLSRKEVEFVVRHMDHFATLFAPLGRDFDYRAAAHKVWDGYGKTWGTSSSRGSPRHRGSRSRSRSGHQGTAAARSSTVSASNDFLQLSQLASPAKDEIEKLYEAGAITPEEYRQMNQSDELYGEEEQRREEQVLANLLPSHEEEEIDDTDNNEQINDEDDGGAPGGDEVSSASAGEGRPDKDAAFSCRHHLCSNKNPDACALCSNILDENVSPTLVTCCGSFLCESCCQPAKWLHEDQDNGGLVVCTVCRRDAPTNDGDKFRMAMEAADRGEAWGQYDVAVRYSTACGVGQCQTKALYWYRKAADQGHSFAFISTGLMYATGTGCVANPALAEEYLRRAADLNPAFHRKEKYLGIRNLSTILLKQGRKEEARDLWLFLAETGLTEAQVSLGAMYYSDFEDTQEAVKWLKLAAVQGCIFAARYLVRCYMDLERYSLARYWLHDIVLKVDPIGSLADDLQQIVQMFQQIEGLCSTCNKVLGTPEQNLCNQCRNCYCNRLCQIRHCGNRGHKIDCKEIGELKEREKELLELMELFKGNPRFFDFDNTAAAKKKSEDGCGTAWDERNAQSPPCANAEIERLYAAGTISREEYMQMKQSDELYIEQRMEVLAISDEGIVSIGTYAGEGGGGPFSIAGDTTAPSNLQSPPVANGNREIVKLYAAGAIARLYAGAVISREEYMQLKESDKIYREQHKDIFESCGEDNVGIGSGSSSKAGDSMASNDFLQSSSRETDVEQDGGRAGWFSGSLDLASQSQLTAGRSLGDEDSEEPRDEVSNPVESQTEEQETVQVAAASASNAQEETAPGVGVAAAAAVASAAIVSVPFFRRKEPKEDDDSVRKEQECPAGGLDDEGSNCIQGDLPASSVAFLEIESLYAAGAISREEYMQMRQSDELYREKANDVKNVDTENNDAWDNDKLLVVSENEDLLKASQHCENHAVECKEAINDDHKTSLPQTCPPLRLLSSAPDQPVANASSPEEQAEENETASTPDKVDVLTMASGMSNAEDTFKEKQTMHTAEPNYDIEVLAPPTAVSASSCEASTEPEGKREGESVFDYWRRRDKKTKSHNGSIPAKPSQLREESESLRDFRTSQLKEESESLRDLQARRTPNGRTNTVMMQRDDNAAEPEDVFACCLESNVGIGSFTGEDIICPSSNADDSTALHDLQPSSRDTGMEQEDVQEALTPNSQSASAAVDQEEKASTAGLRDLWSRIRPDGRTTAVKAQIGENAVEPEDVSESSREGNTSTMLDAGEDSSGSSSKSGDSTASHDSSIETKSKQDDGPEALAPSSHSPAAADRTLGDTHHRHCEEKDSEELRDEEEKASAAGLRVLWARIRPDGRTTMVKAQSDENAVEPKDILESSTLDDDKLLIVRKGEDSVTEGSEDQQSRSPEDDDALLIKQMTQVNEANDALLIKQMAQVNEANEESKSSSEMSIDVASFRRQLCTNKNPDACARCSDVLDENESPTLVTCCGSFLCERCCEPDRWLHDDNGVVVCTVCWKKAPTNDGDKFRMALAAAKRGEAWGQYDVAGRYSSACGVGQSQKKALYWYRKAADQGHTFAYIATGLMYATGTGCIASPSLAEEYLRRAADLDPAFHKKEKYLGIRNLSTILLKQGRKEEAHALWLPLTSAGLPLDQELDESYDDSSVDDEDDRSIAAFC